MEGSDVRDTGSVRIRRELNQRIIIIVPNAVPSPL